MKEVAIKTHLIITDIQEEFRIKWFGKIIDTKPMFKNGLPIFVVIGSGDRVELNTFNMKEIENCAKRLTCPKGRSAISTDKARIYIKEENGNEKYIGAVIHNRIKKFAPMYDKVGFK